MASLQDNFERNLRISEKDNYDEEQYEELFDSSDLKTHLTDASCDMRQTVDGGQSFCPDAVFVKMKDEKAVTEETMFNHGCGEAVAAHYKVVIEYVLLLNLIVILTEVACIILAIIVFSFTEKIDKVKEEYFGDAGLIQSDHTTKM